MLALIIHAPMVVHAPPRPQAHRTLVIAEADTLDLNVKYVKIIETTLSHNK